MVDEPGSRVHEPRDADAIRHPVQISVERDARLRDQVEGAQPGRLAAVLEAELAAHLADEAALAVPLGELPGEEDQVPRPDERKVVGAGYARRRKLDSLLADPGVD